MSNTENGKTNVAELTNEQMEKILSVAKENNIDVTAEQITEVLEKVKSGELSDDELDAVTGGSVFGDIGLLFKILKPMVKSGTEKGLQMMASSIVDFTTKL